MKQQHEPKTKQKKRKNLVTNKETTLLQEETHCRDPLQRPTAETKVGYSSVGICNLGVLRSVMEQADLFPVT